MSLSGYYAPTRVVFGRGAHNQLCEQLKKEKATKILLHYGSGSVIKSGLLEKVKNMLNKGNLEFSEWGGVVPNPRISLVREGVELCRKENIDFILAVGGGSVIDSAKAIGYGLYNGGDAWDFYIGRRKVQGCTPVGVIPTLAATGSEMSNSTVITNEDGVKMKRGCSSDYCRPQFALMNPELTYSVPPFATSCGTVDMMLHTLERFFHAGGGLTLTDRISIALFETIMESGKIVLDQPDDYAARANLMWASSLSHNGLTETGNATKGDWACHQIEHDLSALYDVAHGAGLSAVWASWARYVIDADPGRFAVLGKALFHLADAEESAMAEQTISCFEQYFREIGMPTSLKELGLDLSVDELEMIARKVTNNDGRTIGDFKILYSEDVFEILKMAAG